MTGCGDILAILFLLLLLVGWVTNYPIGWLVGLYIEDEELRRGVLLQIAIVLFIILLIPCILGYMWTLCV